MFEMPTKEERRGLIDAMDIDRLTELAEQAADVVLDTEAMIKCLTDDQANTALKKIKLQSEITELDVKKITTELSIRELKNQLKVQKNNAKCMESDKFAAIRRDKARPR